MHHSTPGLHTQLIIYLSFYNINSSFSKGTKISVVGKSYHHRTLLSNIANSLALFVFAN